MSVRYAECAPAMALGRAMAVAERFIPDGPMLIRAAGVLLRDGVEAQVSVFANERLDALALRLPADQGGVCGGYVLSRRAVALALASPGDRSDLLARVRDDGGQARVQEVEGWRPSGSPWALLEANRRVLEGLRHDVDETALVASRIQGTVVIHRDARVERSLVRGPAIIGAGARVSDSYVGPYSSIGERVVIEGAEIEHSVVLEGAELRFVGTRLEASVIGRGARVTRDFSLPAALRLALGDAAEVTLG
jgi:glucose-1-phosphate thymidylyltransferase